MNMEAWVAKHSADVGFEQFCLINAIYQNIIGNHQNKIGETYIKMYRKSVLLPKYIATNFIAEALRIQKSVEATQTNSFLEHFSLLKLLELLGY